MFDGLSCNLENLYRLSDARTRSISMENTTGEKGKGGMAIPSHPNHLGQGWKVSPNVKIPTGYTQTLCDIEGPGAIQHIWMTPTGNWRQHILRIYWDDSEIPSVETPVGDFFANPVPEPYAPLSSLAVCVNPKTGLNCYWTMPFRKRCRITMENISPEDSWLYYQIDYVEAEVPEDASYFHAQFRRENPVAFGKDYTILDGVRGKGQYVGTSMFWSVNQSGWWGEGEIKFFLDGDSAFPTICGTGTEDYFCGSYNFDIGGKYQEFCTPYSGMPKVLRPDGLYQSQTRFCLYRWHITDPIRFETDLRVTIQDLGHNFTGRMFHQQDDISSVAYWYQTLPTVPFPALPDRDTLEIV